MKRITIGMAALVSFLTPYSFAAPSASPKGDVSIPCYNSGLTFGLAGFTKPLLSNPTEQINASDTNLYENRNTHDLELDYIRL